MHLSWPQPGGFLKIESAHLHTPSGHEQLRLQDRSTKVTSKAESSEKVRGVQGLLASGCTDPDPLVLPGGGNIKSEESLQEIRAVECTFM